jgi:ribosome-associated heat shock protein Hsp15
MNTPAAVRIDRWLWAVRLYHTRARAIAACRAGHVKIEGQSVKPARLVRVGDVLTAQTGPLTRTVKVVGLLAQRVGAKLVPHYLEDLTPPAEYLKCREPQSQPTLAWPKGLGRPTKKQRRALDQLRLGE